MAATFAALETRLNMAVFSRLSNRDATLDWEPVTGIYDGAYALATVGPHGMASSQPTFTLASASVPDSVIGKTLVIGEDTIDTDATTYRVAASEPDGTGLTRLMLELA